MTGQRETRYKVAHYLISATKFSLMAYIIAVVIGINDNLEL